MRNVMKASGEATKQHSGNLRGMGPALAVVMLFLTAGGCNTKHEIVVSQPKPLEVNVNLTGRLEVVLTDAREDMADITGQAPKRKISLEDLGLPPSALAPSTAPAVPSMPASLRMQDSDLAYMMAEAPREAALKKAMAGRYGQIRQLLSAKTLGEAHTGLLAARGALAPAQTALMAAENKDRSELYGLVSQRTGTPLDQVALGYYMARLEHAEKGDWVEIFNKQTNQWEWQQWDK